METEETKNTAELAPSTARKLSKPELVVSHTATESVQILHGRKPIHDVQDKQRYILRFRDQITLMVCMIIAFVSVGGYLYWNAHVNHQVIEVERRPTRAAEFLVDINSASWSELALLPGIGEEKARRIVNMRHRLGGSFADIDDLLQVEGIGPKTLDGLRPHLIPMADAEAQADANDVVPHL